MSANKSISSIRGMRSNNGQALKLGHIFQNGEHNFVLSTGRTALDTPSGVWVSYAPPLDGQKGVVEMLYATRESRIYVAHILGVAALHSIKTYGEIPVGSPNLSAHSFPIQVRLSNLLGQLPATARQNSEDWFSSINNNKYWKDFLESDDSDPLDLSLLSAGLEFTMNILKSGHFNFLSDSGPHVDLSELSEIRRANGRALDEAEMKFTRQEKSA